jgi:hypothetical protein
MIVQNFDLNLIPDSAPVVVHVDQYDHGTGRLRISLYEGDVPYEPSGTAQIQGSKPDGKGFLYNASLSGNIVTANLEEQMTAVAGKVLAQVVVTETSGRIGSFKFVLDVQKSALPDDTDMSESDYQAIEELIEEAQEVAEEVAEDRTAAENAATSAEDSAEDSEAWAKGTRNGTAVPPTDPTYQQNSKYWAGQAEQYAQGGLKFVGTIYFASLPTSGMRAGDMYNIKDAFTTDSRFEEGAGIRYPEGTNVAWTPNNKWDVLAGNIRVLVSITLEQFNALTPAQKNDPTIWWWVPDANNGTMGGSVSSVTAYPELTDKPSINGVEINGAMTSSMLGIVYPGLADLPRINGVTLTGNKNSAALNLIGSSGSGAANVVTLGNGLELNKGDINLVGFNITKPSGTSQTVTLETTNYNYAMNVYKRGGQLDNVYFKLNGVNIYVNITGMQAGSPNILTGTLVNDISDAISLSDTSVWIVGKAKNKGISAGQGAYAHTAGYGASIAVGVGTLASEYGAAFGRNNVAAGQASMAIGQECTADYAYSFASGDGTKTRAMYQAAFGKYNEGKSDTLLEVGNGSSSSRSNAFEVSSSGINVGGDIKKNGSSYIVVEEVTFTYTPAQGVVNISKNVSKSGYKAVGIIGISDGFGNGLTPISVRKCYILSSGSTDTMYVGLVFDVEPASVQTTGHADILYIKN